MRGALPEVQDALAGASAPDLARPSVDGHSPDALKAAELVAGLRAV